MTDTPTSTTSDHKPAINDLYNTPSSAPPQPVDTGGWSGVVVSLLALILGGFAFIQDFELAFSTHERGDPIRERAELLVGLAQVLAIPTLFTAISSIFLYSRKVKIASVVMLGFQLFCLMSAFVEAN